MLYFNATSAPDAPSPLFETNATALLAYETTINLNTAFSASAELAGTRLPMRDLVTPPPESREGLITQKATSFFAELHGGIQDLNNLLDWVSTQLSKPAPFDEPARYQIAMRLPAIVGRLTRVMQDAVYAPRVDGSMADIITAAEQLCSFFGDFNANLQQLGPALFISRFEKLKTGCLEALAGVSQYTVTKYVISLVSQTGVDLSIPLDTLLLMTGVKGAVFDLDDCLADSEDAQEGIWEEVVNRWVSSLRPQPSGNVATQLKEVVATAFQTWQMKELMPRLYATAGALGVLPPQVSDVADLHRFTTQLREPLVRDACKQGTIKLLPGAYDVLEGLHKRGILTGLFTSNPPPIASAILDTLLPDDGNGSLCASMLLPPRHRVYGPEIACGKPDPLGWILAAEALGLPLRQVAVVDDHLNVIANAARVGEQNNGADHFGAVIGLYLKGQRIPEWQRMLNEPCDRGTHRIIVRNLRHITD